MINMLSERLARALLKSGFLRSWKKFDLQRWEQTRRIGRPRFVWLYGVGLIGGVFGFMISLAVYRQAYGWEWPMRDFVSILPLLFSMSFWLICGYLCTLVFWSTMEVYHFGRVDQP